MTVKHRVGPVTDIPENEGVRVEIGEHFIAVFRVGSAVHAVGDQCPHMGASLSEGYLDGKTVICPWHGWVFDLNNGTSPFDEDAKVPVYRVVVENGDVFVEVDTVALDPGCAPDGCPSTPDAQES
jgi:nitrite reductase/ring-hydroxylating ferredoxin subunit